MCGHEGDWSGEAWNPWGHVIPKCLCHLGFCFCYIVCCLVTDKHLFDQGLPESQFLWGWYCGLTSSGATWWKGLCPALVWTWFVPTQIFVESRSSVQRGGRSLGESVFSSQASCCNSVSLPHVPACLPTSSSRTWAECWGHALGSRTPRQIDTVSLSTMLSSAFCWSRGTRADTCLVLQGQFRKYRNKSLSTQYYGRESRQDRRGECDQKRPLCKEPLGKW